MKDCGDPIVIPELANKHGKIFVPVRCDHCNSCYRHIQFSTCIYGGPFQWQIEQTTLEATEN